MGGESEYGTIPYEVDEITTFLETWLNDNMAGIVDTALESVTTKPRMIEFWSEPETCSLTNSIQTNDLKDVVIPDLDLTIDKAYAMFMMEYIRNTSASDNYFNRIVMRIQVNQNAEGWLSAIQPQEYNEAFRVDGNSSLMGTVIMVGAVDIISRVDFGSTTNFRWFEKRALAPYLYVQVRTGVRIIGS